MGAGFKYVIGGIDRCLFVYVFQRLAYWIQPIDK